MATMILAWGLCLVAAAPADPTGAAAAPAVVLSEGALVPAFESVDDRGAAWKSAEHVGQKVVVLYFYPGDFTGGCIKQAQAFREALVKLEALGVELVGVSGDGVQTHRLFKESHGLAHTLLADPEGKLAATLGVPVSKGAKVRTRDLTGKPLLDDKGKSIILERQATLARWTFVIDRAGKLAAKRTQVNPATDAEEVQKLVEALGK